MTDFDTITRNVFDRLDHERFLVTARLVGAAEVEAEAGDWQTCWNLMHEADLTIRLIKDPTRQSVAWEKYEERYLRLETACLNEKE